jgi:hypothetical protein
VKPHTLESALLVLSSDDEIDPKLLYDCAVLIDEASVKNKSFDREAKKAFERCLNTQTYINDGEDFLDSCRRYIRLLLKYKQWKDSWNFLQLYDALTSPEVYSIWYLCAKAKVEYELFPEESFATPSCVLQYISKAFPLSTNRLQVESVLKEFISKAEDYFSTSGDGVRSLAVFINQVRQYLPEDSIDNVNGLNIIAREDIENVLVSTPDTGTDEANNANLVDVNNEALINRISALQRQHQIDQCKLDDLISENIALNEEIENLKQASEKHEVEKIKYDLDLPKTNRKLRILVLGSGHIKPKIILGIAKAFNLHKENFDIHLDYSKNKRFSLGDIRWNSSHAGILIGPIAHNTVDLGDYNSPLEKLKEEGYPPCVEMRNKSGGLKVTKTSVRGAIESLINQIRIIDPDIIPQRS